MRKFFTIVAKILASIFAVLLVLSAILAILSSTLERKVFSAKVYMDALVEEQIYDRLPVILAETVRTNLPTDASEDQGEISPAIENLSSANLESIIRTLLPPAELQTMTENAIEQIFAYLNGEVDSVKLSLVGLKARLNGQAGVEAITQLLQAQPDCTAAQLVQIITNAGNESQELLLCNPGEPTLKAMTPILQWALANATDQVPDEVTLVKSTPPSANTPNNGPFGIADPIRALHTGRLIMRLSPLLPLAFLLLVTLFGVRSVKGWMRWWGIPFFFAGIFALILGLAAQPVLNWVWNTFLVTSLPSSLPASLAEVGHGLVSSIARSLVKEILLQAIALTVLGLGAWIGSHFVKTAQIKN